MNRLVLLAALTMASAALPPTGSAACLSTSDLAPPVAHAEACAESADEPLFLSAEACPTSAETPECSLGASTAFIARAEAVPLALVACIVTPLEHCVVQEPASELPDTSACEAALLGGGVVNLLDGLLKDPCVQSLPSGTGATLLDCIETESCNFVSNPTQLPLGAVIQINYEAGTFREAIISPGWDCGVSNLVYDSITYVCRPVTGEFTCANFEVTGLTVGGQIRAATECGGHVAVCAAHGSYNGGSCHNKAWTPPTLPPPLRCSMYIDIAPAKANAVCYNDP